MGSDPEIQAMITVSDALADLDDGQRERVFQWAARRFGVELGPKHAHQGDGAQDDHAHGAQNDFSVFAELFAAANPTTDSQKALVAAYWVQIHGDRSSFQSADLNLELRNLGHYVADIAHALGRLIAVKPQQVLQLKKAGNSQQARKTYKLTVAGVQAVEDMLEAKPTNGEGR